MYKYNMLPAHMRSSVKEYVENGTKKGDFLMALLTNNLKESFGRADAENLRCMETWVQFLRWELPSACHGSVLNVRNWIEMGGEAGQARLDAKKRREERETASATTES